MGNPLTFLAGAAVGAAAAYFLDPEGGARRRNETRDKAISKAKSGAQGAAGTAKQAAGKARGGVHSVTPTMPGKGEAPDDVTLARKVETEIFRDADAPKGQVDVNVVDGVVYLRGEVEEDLIRDLEEAARKVSGVRGVENLLHTPGTPAPTTPEGSASSPSS
jgi:osmotically-inducible protein OsmY